MIRSATLLDAESIANIYNYYIEHTVVTFEEKVITSEEIAKRVRAVHEMYPWLVFTESDQILGYAYATPWKPRSAYRFSVEVSVYVKKGSEGKGIGKLLYSELFRQLHALDVHAVIGGMTLPNEASKALHEKFGFTQVAHFKETGFKFGKWWDMGYWELILE